MTGAVTGERRAPTVSVAVVAALITFLAVIAAPAGAQVDDTTPPPTPTGILVTAADGGTSAGIGFDGDDGSLDIFSSHRNAAIDAAAGHDGNAGVRIASSNAPGYVRWRSDVVGAGNGYALVSMWVRVMDRGENQSVDLLTVANTGSTRNFDFFVAADTQRFKWDIFRDSSDETPFSITYGQWYFVEVRVSYAGSTHWAEVRIGGAYQGRIESAGISASVASVTMGSHGVKTHVQDYDSIEARFDSTVLDWDAPVGDGATVTVSWTPVVDVGSGLREYQIWRNGSWFDWAPPDADMWVDTSPVDGAYYQVRAIDQALNRSGWSTRAYVDTPDRTPPPAPTNLGVALGAGGSATLGWDPVVDVGGSGLREYAIFRNGSWCGWVAAPVTEFVDQNPVAGASYQVRAFDQALNQSARSQPVTLL